MHQMRRATDFRAESRADGLMSQANPENRNFAGKMPDQFDADACILRRTRPGRNYDALGPEIFKFADRDLVVAANLNLGAEFSEILDQVVGKGIVIVENEDHNGALAIAYTQHGADLIDEASILRLNVLFPRTCVVLTQPREAAILRKNLTPLYSLE